MYYMPYLSNQNSMKQSINVLSKNDVKSCIKKAYKDPKVQKHFDLNTWLYKPVERINKYPQYLKVVPITHVRKF